MYGTQSFMPQFLRQHLHFCTCKASKVSTLMPQSRSSGPVAIDMGKLPTPTESTCESVGNSTKTTASLRSLKRERERARERERERERERDVA